MNLGNMSTSNISASTITNTHLILYQGTDCHLSTDGSQNPACILTSSYSILNEYEDVKFTIRQRYACPIIYNNTFK